MKQKLRKPQTHQLQDLMPISLLGVEQAPPLWTHPDGCDFIRGTSITIKPHVMEERRINEMQALLLKSLWTPVELPNHNNNHTPWPANSQPLQVFCGQQASVQLSTDKIKPLLDSLQQKLAIDSAHAELELNEILASHRDLRYSEWKNIIMANPDWQRNAAQAKATEIQCSGLGGAELDVDWDVLLACKRHAHVYGPSLSKQDDWPTRAATVAGTAHTQEYLMLHIAMLPIGLHAWRRVLGVQTEPPVQAQIIGRAIKLLEFCPITPAHRKPPWPGYIQCLRLFTHLLVEHPLVGLCVPLHIRSDTCLDQDYMTGTMKIRGHSAGSYSGMVWETIMAEFPQIQGETILAAIALPPTLLIRRKPSHSRAVRLIHHADDKLCVWFPTKQILRMFEHNGILTTLVTGWRSHLSTAQHNYAHWTRIKLPPGQHDIAELERLPGVLPFAVYAQAPLRLISWCSFELPKPARQLLRRLATLCEAPGTTTHALVKLIAQQASQVQTEQAAAQYLATLTTVSIAARAGMPTYTTMVPVVPHKAVAEVSE